MSTTPRTDAAYFKQGATMYDLAEESKKLETELAAEREKSERYRLASLKLDVELVAMKAREEHAEVLIRALCKICSTPIGAASEDSK